MPIVQVSFIEGPTAEQQRRLLSSLTAAVVEDLGVPAEAVNVLLTPVPATNWAHAGRPLSETLGR